MVLIKLFVLGLIWTITEAVKFKGCRDNGEILPHPTDQCSYIVCSYAASFNGHYGNSVVPVPRRCAPGTSVDTYEFDPYNPCSVTSDYCQPEFEIRYIGKVPYDLDEANEVTSKKRTSYEMYKPKSHPKDIERKKSARVIYKNNDLRQGRHESDAKGYAVGKYDDKYKNQAEKKAERYEDFPNHRGVADDSDKDVYLSSPAKGRKRGDYEQHYEQNPTESESYGEVETESITSESRGKEKHDGKYGGSNYGSPQQHKSYGQEASHGGHHKPSSRKRTSRRDYDTDWDDSEYDEIDYGARSRGRSSNSKDSNKERDSSNSKSSQKDQEYEYENHSPSRGKYNVIKQVHRPRNNHGGNHNQNSRKWKRPDYSIDDVARYDYYPKGEDKNRYTPRRKSGQRHSRKNGNNFKFDHDEHTDYSIRDRYEKSARLPSTIAPTSTYTKDSNVARTYAKDNIAKRTYAKDNMAQRTYTKDYKEPKKYSVVKFNGYDNSHKGAQKIDDVEKYPAYRYQYKTKSPKVHTEAIKPIKYNVNYDLNKYQTYNGY